MFLFIFISLVSTSKIIQITDDNQNYSEEVTQTQFNETYTFLTDASVDYYYFQIYQSTRYEEISVALAASQTQAPYFDSSNKLIYQQFDTNGYQLKKQYLYLILKKSADPYYITILVDSSISYEIKAYLSLNKLCSESCSMHGTCYSGKCICQSKSIGDDCTIPANEITEELTSFKSGYFYQDFKELESITFDITSFTDGIIYFLFETTQISVPTIETFDYALELASEIPQKFSLQYPDSGTHKVIIYVPPPMQVKFVTQNEVINNPGTTSNEDSTSLSSDSIILICSIIPGVLLFVALVVLCVKGKFKRSTVELTVTHLDGPIDYGSQFPKQEGVCSICLGAFNNPAEIRRTPCNHKFHSICIQKQINKGNNHCPVCRAEISMGTLF